MADHFDEDQTIHIRKYNPDHLSKELSQAQDTINNVMPANRKEAERYQQTLTEWSKLAELIRKQADEYGVHCEDMRREWELMLYGSVGKRLEQMEELKRQIDKSIGVFGSVNGASD